MKKACDLALTAIFLLLISLPLLGYPLGLGKSREAFRFEAAPPLPEAHGGIRSKLEAPLKLKDYYNWAFRFRGELTALHAHLKVRLFKVSSSPKVTLGSDGWLFFAGESLVDCYRNRRPFTQAELQTWARVQSARNQWLKARGIVYVFFVAPNPQTIYSDKMPESLWRLSEPSRLSQLTDYLKKNTDVPVVDLREPLDQAKKAGQIYYQTDTHWNQLGGFIAYETVLTRLNSLLGGKLSPHKLADFEARRVENWYGGLTYFLGAPGLLVETKPEYAAKFPSQVTSDGVPLTLDETDDAWNVKEKVVRECPQGEMASAVIFRDSQMAAPSYFLCRHFRRTVLLWSYRFDPSVVLQERPQLVIQEMVERSLMNPPPEDPPLP